MKVFVALAYDRNHETKFCGIAGDRNKCLQMIARCLGEDVFFSPYAIDGPDGHVAVDGRDGMVGTIRCEEFSHITDERIEQLLGAGNAMYEVFSPSDAHYARATAWASLVTSIAKV